MRIIEFEEINSTNEFCKQYEGDDDIIVFAGRQTAGRGTKGRSFCSDEGGLYYTVMRRYENFPADQAFKIMINSCVSVCRALEKIGVKPVIRWANDVMANGRKISGTLIENTFSNGHIVRSIVGTGINLNNTFPKELEDIAISASQCTGKKVDIRSFKNQIYNNIGKNYTISDYLGYINWLGQEVRIVTQSGIYTAVALGIEEDGRLIVRREGEIIKISSGEVSLRL